MKDRISRYRSNQCFGITVLITKPTFRTNNVNTILKRPKCEQKEHRPNKLNKAICMCLSCIISEILNIEWWRILDNMGYGRSPRERMRYLCIAEIYRLRTIFLPQIVWLGTEESWNRTVFATVSQEKKAFLLWSCAMKRRKLHGERNNARCYFSSKKKRKTKNTLAR